jgi:Tfp pilus assembly protein PilF
MTKFSTSPGRVGAGGRFRAGLAVVALLAVGAVPEGARAQQPSVPEPHYQAAHAAFTSGNVTKANLEVKLALQANPTDAASHFLLGCLLERQGQTDQAIVGFQQALALNPTNPETLYNLGTLLLRKGETAPASTLLENAVLVRPDHVPTYVNLGKAYFLAGLPQLAVAAYEEALRRDPSNVLALKNLALLAEAAGHQETAASYRRRLGATAPGKPGAPGTGGQPNASAPTWPIATGLDRSLSSASPSDVVALQPPPDEEADSLRDLLRDLAHVRVERRGGRLTLLGWTRSPQEKEMLGRIIAGRKDVLDLTSDDALDTQRMLEVDAIILIQYKINQTTIGTNFLNLIKTNFSYFATDARHEGTGYTGPPSTVGAVTGAFQAGWIFSAALDYTVNIANAATQQVAVLARPHLTTLSGTPATFLAGGEIVFKVSGINSGDIKPYPFGTTLKVTPTLLRAVGEDGRPQVYISVEAGRTSVLDLLSGFQTVDQVSFDKVSVASQTVVGLGQTLILSGLNQRESRTGRSGVPGLMYVPILKYFFSTKTIVQNDVAVVILLTPRDPGYMDAQNRAALSEFVAKRKAYVEATKGTDEDMRRFRQQYPDWDQLAPNRFASHFFLMNNSALYRFVSGQDVVTEELDVDILSSPEKKKEKKTP